MKKLSVVALLIQPLTPAMAQEEAPVLDEAMERCISTRRIRSTHVVDSRNILFYMTGKTVYHNILPRQCAGLAREKRFSYRSSVGRICRNDFISVLENGAFGLREGVACGLGAFHEITREDAKAIKAAPKQKPESQPLPMPDPESVGGEDEQADEPEY